MTVCSGLLTAAHGSKMSGLHKCSDYRVAAIVVCGGHPPPVAAISTWPSDGSCL